MNHTENQKKKGKSKRENTILWIFAAVLLLAVIAVVVLAVRHFTGDKPGQSGTETTELAFDIPGFTVLDTQLAQPEGTLEITALGRYTGAFVEDGKNEDVTDVLALIVKNTGEDWLEYAQITLDCGGTATATFSLSALPAGSSALVMETNRLTYAAGTAYTVTKAPSCAALTSAVMDFSQTFALYPDDGVINIKNISDRDISSDVCVYYKNFRYGLYMGGICYRARVEGGIAAGEIAQSIQTHYSNDDSVILYMTYDN